MVEERTNAHFLPWVPVEEPLGSLWERQRVFTQSVLKGTRKLELGSIEGAELVSITEKYLLSLHKELDEALDDIAWKEHRLAEQPQLRDNVVEELIDVQKYLWGLMQIWGVTAGEFSQLFNDKSFVVEERWRMRQTPMKQRIAVVDIDGVLFKHSQAFQRWLAINKPYMAGMRKKDNARAWEEAQWEYRLSHDKRHGEADEANISVLRGMAADGWSIVLMTYRPRKLYQSLEYDTLYWLHENGVPYDNLVWAAYEKYFYVKEEFSAADIFIDDEMETCQLVASLGGIRVYHIRPELSSLYGEVDGLIETPDLAGVARWEAGMVAPPKAH